MDKKNHELQEQEAPLKNTDNAFVKVGDDGKPVMPEEESTVQEEDEEEEKHS